MSMGKRKRDRQPAMWVTTTDLPTAASHPFYRRLNQLLREHGFDDFVEAQCAGFYAATMGRPGLPPGIYFRLLLIGYFEGIDSERGIAWRAADSLALRDFLGLDLHDVPPDHSTISRTRRLIVVETHRAVFTWVAQCLGHAGLIKGKTIGLDATTLEANAALRSIVRRDTGEGYEDFLTRLAKASGIGTPTRADLARLDRKRKKKGSNDEWTHPRDPDAKITKMKDGRTHLAHKAEHAIDLETGAIVGVTVQGADQGDTTTMQQTLPEAAAQLEAQKRTGQIISWVFHRGGAQIKDFLHGWHAACEKAGLAGRIPHDFRRTALRRYERAGVARSVAMKLTGHKTESVYRRYAIVGSADLRAGLATVAALPSLETKSAQVVVMGAATEATAQVPPKSRRSGPRPATMRAR